MSERDFLREENDNLRERVRQLEMRIAGSVPGIGMIPEREAGAVRGPSQFNKGWPEHHHADELFEQLDIEPDSHQHACISDLVRTAMCWAVHNCGWMELCDIREELRKAGMDYHGTGVALRSVRQLIGDMGAQE